MVKRVWLRGVPVGTRAHPQLGGPVENYPKHFAILSAFLAGAVVAACATTAGSANADTPSACSAWEYKIEQDECDNGEACDAGSWEAVSIAYIGGTQVLFKRCAE